MPGKLRALMPLGMLSGVIYVGAILWAEAHWQGYSPMSDFVSYLSAYGSPNGTVVWAVDVAHNLLLLAFVAGVYALRRAEETRIRRGYLLLLWMALLAFFGYTLIPLNAYEPFFSPRNLTHFVLTIVVVLGMLLSLVMVGMGHLAAGDGWLGYGSLTGALLIALMGVLTIASMVFWRGILGIFQRGMIFSVQAIVFYLSLVHTARCIRGPAVV